MALPPLPTIRDLIRLFGLRAKQQLSQNFILDLNVSNKIISKTAANIGPLVGKTVIEVGPGPGPLTRSILNSGCQNLIVVEKDVRFLSSLNMLKDAAEKKNAKLTIINDDIMDVDEKQLLEQAGHTKKCSWNETSDIVIIGNLPFSVSTALVIKWIRQIHNRTGAFAYGRTAMALTFQKEVAHRIVAQPGSKEYNRLSVMVQHCCDTKLLFDIGSKNFVPQPKVDAGVVYIEPKIKPEIDVDVYALEQMCRLIFSGKRKIIANGVKNIDPMAGVLLELAGINPQVRAEEVDVNHLCLLSNIYKASSFYKQEL